MITKAQKNQWLADLRSGKFEQAHGTLRDTNDAYCCLGILGRQFGTYDGEYLRLSDEDEFGTGIRFCGYLPDRILSKGLQGVLADMNDSENCNFYEIADYIEENINVSEPEA